MQEKYNNQIVFASILTATIALVWYFQFLGTLPAPLWIFGGHIFWLFIIPAGIVVWAVVNNFFNKEKQFDKHLVILGKTGILTDGNLRVIEILTVKNMPIDKSRVLALAASLAQRSSHPISQAITDYAKQQRAILVQPQKMEEFSGLGLHGFVGGRLAKLGNQRFMRNGFVEDSYLGENHNTHITGGKRLVYVAYDGELLGAIVLEDSINNEASRHIQNFHQKGIVVTLLSSDHNFTNNNLSEQFGIERISSELTAEQKNKIVEKIQRSGKIVITLGHKDRHRPTPFANNHIEVENNDLNFLKIFKAF